MLKKLSALAVVALAGLAVTRRIAARKAEQELWTEATDPVEPR